LRIDLDDAHVSYEDGPVWAAADRIRARNATGAAKSVSNKDRLSGRMISPRSPDVEELFLLQPARQGKVFAARAEPRRLLAQHRFGDRDGSAPITAELRGKPSLTTHGASIIVTASTTAIRAAHRAAPNVAIVSWGSGDPVLMGWAQTLARPAGMITGLFLVASTVAKPLELLKEMRPLATTFGYLFNATNPGNAEFRRIVEEAATRLGIKVDIIEVTELSELAEAFRRMQSYGAQGAAVIPDPLFNSNLPMISRLAREHRIPTVGDGRDFAKHGGLLAQSVNYLVLARRSAWYVDQILKGTPPGELPAEQTTEYKVIVNLKTAKELGLLFLLPFWLAPTR
jgi:ABC-type uncharacterized transport system substrate-binding protein